MQQLYTPVQIAHTYCRFYSHSIKLTGEPITLKGFQNLLISSLDTMQWKFLASYRSRQEAYQWVLLAVLFWQTLTCIMSLTSLSVLYIIPLSYIKGFWMIFLWLHNLVSTYSKPWLILLIISWTFHWTNREQSLSLCISLMFRFNIKIIIGVLACIVRK